MSSRRASVGWLAIPAFLLALALVGMAVTTEPREQFEQRANQQSDGGDGDDGGATDERDPRSNGSERGDNPQTGQDGDIQQGDIEQGDGRSGEPEDRRSIVIRTETGDVVIEVDEDGTPQRAVPGDSAFPSDPSRVLTPDADGEFVGIRINDDGELEPVGVGDVGVDDFRLRPTGDGLEITRPDGSRLRLRPTEDGRLSGTEIAADGTSSEVPGQDGEVLIQPGDGTGSETGGEPGDQPIGDPIVVDTEAGPVRIELEPNRDLVANQPDPGSGVAFGDEDLSAIRVDENGDLEIVPLDEVGPEDTVLRPNGGGFDLVRPDGSRVEFRADGENDGITATAISPDGQARELTPNADGSVTLDDGTTIGPIDIAEDGGPIEQLLDQTSDLPWRWVAAAIAMLAVLSSGTALYLHRNRPRGGFDPAGLAGSGMPEDQLETFLSILANDEDPSRSIRLAFYAVERGMAGLPARHVNETPFEWHARVEQIRPDLAVPLAPICDLFALARFAPGHASPADRDLMVEHIRELNEVARRSAGQRPMAGV